MRPSLKAAQAWLEKYNFSDLLPYLSFDHNREIFINNQSAGFVLETLPLIGSSEQIERQLAGFLQHTLPEGSNLQFLLVASPRIDHWLQAWKQPRKSAGIIQVLAEKRVEFLKKRVKQSTQYYGCLRTFRVIISFSIPINKLIDLELDEVATLKQQFLSTLESLGLPVKIWQATDLIRGLDELLNISDRLDVPKKIWNEHQSLAEQMLSPDTHFLVQKDKLLQKDGEYSIQLYQASVFPEEWCLSEMGNFIGDQMQEQMQIPMPFAIHYGVNICKEVGLKARLLTKCAQIEHQANSPIAKWIPSLRKEAENWAVARQKLESGQRLARTQFQVILMGLTENMPHSEQKLNNLFRAQGWELSRESFTVLPSFIGCLPMSWGAGALHDQKLFEKTKITVSNEPVNLLPIQGEWHGTKSPGMILTGRRGQIFFWHPFDNKSGNFNTCVVGRSGSGKSVFMQEMMTANLGSGGRVFVLDVGRSFERTAKLLGGQFIEFSTKSPICINPFSAIPTDSPEDTIDALAMLKPIIALMAAPTMGTDDLEKAFIEKAIHVAWSAHKNSATITHVSEYLLQHKDLKAKSLGEMLYPYTAKGSFGRFFEGDANIDLTANLVVLELEELKERKDLQAVVVQIIILQITNQVYLGDRKTPTQIILDEAWDMLRGKQSGEFIETAARRLRKYHGGLVVGTQSVNDFYQSPGAQAAFDNSDWLCLLSQKKESIEQLKKSQRLSMDPYMETLMRSVRTEQGKFAEVMISGVNGYAIGRLLLDPFSKLLYSTKAEDYTDILDYQKQGFPLTEAIERVMYGRNSQE